MKPAIVALLVFAASAAESQYLTAPADALPSDDARIARGHDQIRLMSAAMKFRPKSEFESSAEFEARAAQYGATPVYGQVALSGKVAINLGFVSPRESIYEIGYKYDADAETLAVCVPAGGRRYIKEAGTTWRAAEVWLWNKVIKTGTYVGRNAFGARATVQKQRLIGARLIVPTGGPSDDCAKAVKMTPAEARRSLLAASLVIVGRFIPPFGEKFEDLDKATVDDPIEQTTLLDEAPFVIDELLLVTSGSVIYRQPPPERSKAY